MGYRIREVRQEKRLSQQELARKSGVSRATISALENGTGRQVMTGTLLKLCRALNIPIDQVFRSDNV